MASPREGNDDTSGTHSHAGEASESEDGSRDTQNTDLTELSEDEENHALGRRAKRARSESPEPSPRDAAWLRANFQEDVILSFDGGH